MTAPLVPPVTLKASGSSAFPAFRRICSVDVAALRFKLLGLPEDAWSEDALRQQKFEQHKQTQSIVMLFSESWPKIVVEKRSGYDPFFKDAEPILKNVLSHYPPGGIIIRTMFARMPPGSKINRHFDSHPNFGISHRIHVPIATNPGVNFLVDDKRAEMPVGGAYEINNLRFHQVENTGGENRIHLIFDYVPPRSHAA